MSKMSSKEFMHVLSLINKNNPEIDITQLFIREQLTMKRPIISRLEHKLTKAKDIYRSRFNSKHTFRHEHCYHDALLKYLRTKYCYHSKILIDGNLCPISTAYITTYMVTNNSFELRICELLIHYRDNVDSIDKIALLSKLPVFENSDMKHLRAITIQTI